MAAWHLRRALVQGSLWVVITASLISRAQETPSNAAPAGEKPKAAQSSDQQNSNPPSGSKGEAAPAEQAPSDSSPKDSSAKDDSKPESATDAAKQEVQNVMGTVNQKMNETVDNLRRLPAEWFLGAYVPADRDLRPLTMGERKDVYLRQTYFTGASYLKRLLGAGMDQARGAPPEWGGGMGGYGKRFASRYGEFIIQNSLAAAGNAALHYEPRYDYCKCTGFWPRTKHAIARNFYTYNETESEKRVQIPLYVGAFGAGAIGTAVWRPDNENKWKNGAYSVASQAGFGVLTNWLQEFALDIGHKIAPKKRRSGASPGQVETPSQ